MDRRQPEPVVIPFALVQVEPDKEFYVLQAAGQGCVCPFQPVIWQQDPDGNNVATRSCCNTACPLASVETHDQRVSPEEEPPFPQEHYFTVSCGGVPVERRVEIQRATRLVKPPTILRPAN